MRKSEMIEELVNYFSQGNKAQFAKQLGVSPQTISAWIKRDSFDNELIYTKCRGVSATWLLTGEGDMISADQQPKVSDVPAEGTPYYDVDFIGGFNEIVNSQITVPTTNIIVQGFDKADLWCNVTGHSMEPKINHGDIIALRRCDLRDIQFGEIYAVVLDTIRTIKIIRRSPNPDTFLFVPINKDYDAQEYEKSRILQVFEVIGSISKFF